MTEDLINYSDKNNFVMQSNTIALLSNLFSSDSHLPNIKERDEHGNEIDTGRSEPVQNSVTFYSKSDSGATYRNQIHYSAAWGLLRPNEQELLTKIFYLFSEHKKFEFADQIEINRKDYASKTEYERARKNELSRQIDQNRTIHVSRKELVEVMGRKSRSSFVHIERSLKRLMAVTIIKSQIKVVDESNQVLDIDPDSEGFDDSGIGTQGTSLLNANFQAEESVGRIELSSDIVLDFLTGNFFIIDIDWLTRVPRGRNRILLDYMNARLHQEENNMFYAPVDDILEDVLKMSINSKVRRGNKSKLKKLLESFENLSFLEPCITVGSEISKYEIFSNHEFEEIIDGEVKKVVKEAVCFKAGPKILLCKKYKKENHPLYRKVAHGVTIPKVDTQRKQALHERMYNTTLSEKYVNFFLAVCENDMSYPSLGESYDRKNNIYRKNYIVVDGGFKIASFIDGERNENFIPLDYTTLEKRVDYFELFFKYSPNREAFEARKGGWFRSLIDGGNYDHVMHDKLFQESEKEKRSKISVAEKKATEKRISVTLSERFKSLQVKFPLSRDDDNLIRQALLHIRDESHRRILSKHIALRKGDIIYLVVSSLAMRSYVDKNSYDALFARSCSVSDTSFRFLEMSEDKAEDLENFGEEVDLNTDVFYTPQDYEDDVSMDDVLNPNINESSLKDENRFDKEEDEDHLSSFRSFYEQFCKADVMMANLLIRPMISKFSESDKHIVSRSFAGGVFTPNPEVEAVLRTHFEKPESLF